MLLPPDMASHLALQGTTVAGTMAGTVIGTTVGKTMGIPAPVVREACMTRAQGEVRLGWDWGMRMGLRDRCMQDTVCLGKVQGH